MSTIPPTESIGANFMRINRARLPHTLFQVGMCVLFFTFLFFTWIQNIQQMILESQVDRVFKDINRDLRLLDLYNTIRPRILIEFKNLLAQNRGDINTKDEEIKASNQSVKTEVWIVSGLIFISCMIGTYIFVKRQGISWSEVILEGLITAIVLSIVLVLFLYLVVQNYDLIDPNIVKKTLVDALIEYSK
jgi:hypothetical protein